MSYKFIKPAEFFEIQEDNKNYQDEQDAKAILKLIEDAMQKTFGYKKCTRWDDNSAIYEFVIKYDRTISKESHDTIRETILANDWERFRIGRIDVGYSIYLHTPPLDFLDQYEENSNS